MPTSCTHHSSPIPTYCTARTLSLLRSLRTGDTIPLAFPQPPTSITSQASSVMRITMRFPRRLFVRIMHGCLCGNCYRYHAQLRLSRRFDETASSSYDSPCFPSQSGGIGRRAGLKIPWPSGRVGSTPTSGTSSPALRGFLFARCLLTRIEIALIAC